MTWVHHRAQLPFARERVFAYVNDYRSVVPGCGCSLNKFDPV